jgi:hypothetical protein
MEMIGRGFSVGDFDTKDTKSTKGSARQLPPDGHRRQDWGRITEIIREPIQAIIYTLVSFVAFVFNRTSKATLPQTLIFLLHGLMCVFGRIFTDPIRLPWVEE